MREKGKGAGIFVLEGNKGLPLDRGKTGMAHGKMAFMKVQREKPVLG